MFSNIGWGELFIVATLAILVVGPKELPQFLRVCGRYFAKVKGIADDFRSQFDDVVRETQIEDIKDNILKEVDGVKAALPSEKDMGLDYSELDSSSKSGSDEEDYLDEDENLDWDEPDELIEKDADGEVISHSKKETVAGEEQPASGEDAEDGKPLQTAENSSGETGQEAVQAEGVSGEQSDGYDDDDGALLDEEEYSGDAMTSRDILESGREKFRESVEADEKAAHKNSLLDERLELAKATKDSAAKKEAERALETPVANG